MIKGNVYFSLVYLWMFIMMFGLIDGFVDKSFFEGLEGLWDWWEWRKARENDIDMYRVVIWFGLCFRVLTYMIYFYIDKYYYFYLMDNEIEVYLG